MTNMIESNFRKYVFYTANIGCWVHMIAALTLAKSQGMAVGLFVGALALAGLFTLLGSTKRTLAAEQNLPAAFYTIASWGWAIAGIVWLLLGQV